MKTVIRLLGVLLTGTVAFAPRAARAQALIAKEYKIKATYLFNFAQYVEWPPEAFADAGAPIVIGLLGNDDFGPFLDELLRGETIANHPFSVKRSRQVEDLKACNLLFISKSETAHLAVTLAALGDAGVLTVGETEGFAQGGGIINFIPEGDKVRFEINLEAARRRGLKLNSRLLSVAKIVGPGAGKEKK